MKKLLQDLKNQFILDFKTAPTILFLEFFGILQ